MCYFYLKVDFEWNFFYFILYNVCLYTIQCILYIIDNFGVKFLIKMLKSGRSKRAQISPWRSYPERNWNQSFTFLQICKFAKLRPGNSCWLSLLAPSPNNLQPSSAFQLKRKSVEWRGSNLIIVMQLCWLCGRGKIYFPLLGFLTFCKVGPGLKFFVEPAGRLSENFAHCAERQDTNVLTICDKYSRACF